MQFNHTPVHNYYAVCFVWLWRMFICFERNSFIISDVLGSELLHGTDSSFRSEKSHSKSINSPHLWIRNFHHRVHKSLPLLPIQSEKNPVQVPSFCCLQNNFLMLSSQLRLVLLKCLFPWGFATKTLNEFLFPSIHSPSSSSFIWPCE